MIRIAAPPLLALALLPCLACSKPAGDSPAAVASKWALKAEPAGAISVVDAQKAAPKDEVVVVGRLREFVPGLAAFTMVDASVAYCGDPQAGAEAMKEVCEMPWDYCCHEQEAADKQIAVLVPEGAGAAKGPVPELRNLDLVVVRGRLVKDKAGSVELAATGWWRKERPTLPASIKFPQ